MPDLGGTLLGGVILSVPACLLLLAALRINPRLLLHAYPAEIRRQVPPKTRSERRLSLLFGIPFLTLLLAVPLISTLELEHGHESNPSFLGLFLNASGILLIFTLVDLLFLDWLVFCRITPRFLIIPGTEGAAAYKDWGFHLRGALRGALLSLSAGLAIAGMVWLL